MPYYYDTRRKKDGARHKAGKVVHAVVLPWKELQMAHQCMVYISGHVPNAGMSCM